MGVNSLFKTSYFHDMRHEDNFVVLKHSSAPGATSKEFFRLTEWEQRCTPRCVSWPAASNHPAMPVAKVFERYPSEFLFCMFWSLRDWWVASSFTDFFSAKKRRQFKATDNWVTPRFRLHPKHWGEQSFVGGMAFVKPFRALPAHSC